MTPLRAGPLELLFGEEGDLRRIRLGGLEVVRRIYFAVRDRNWNTIPARITGLRLADSGDSFDVRFRAVHESGEIGFEWQVHIRGAGDGVIRYEAGGRATTSFLRNRIGLCVHHPLRECAGLKVRIDGREAEFPRMVSPHQVFQDFRRMRYTLLPGLDVELDLEGEVFETEDHRNWGDAGYKTYGTPLRLPFPVEVRAGDAVRQAATLRLHGRIPHDLPGPAAPKLEPAGPWQAVPPVGFGYSPEGDVAGLRPAHLRVDLREGELPPRISVPLELAVHLAPGKEQEQLEALSGWQPSLARLLVFHQQEKVTSPRWLALARQTLPGATVVGGTNMWFAELNRERPPLPAPPVAFALSPQVHASDEFSMVENLEAFPWMLESASRFLGGAPVHVSPVTLKPRFNPVATDPSAPFDNTDPRQGSDFAAAWTLGALASLFSGKPASVTFYETAGPRGLEHGGQRFPLYRLFAALAPYYGGEFAPAGSPAALWLRKQKRRALFLANLSAAAEEFPLPAIEGGNLRLRLLGGGVQEARGPGRVLLPAWGVLVCEWEGE